ncbi:ROK family protein [Bacteroidota bacterium]
MAVIGLDLGGTKLSSAMFNNEGEILFKDKVALGTREGNEVGDLIKKQISTILDLKNRGRDEIKAIGVSVPGISYTKSGKVWAPNIRGWEDYPLQEDILSIIDKNKIQVKIDSDRACYILGEVWKGTAQDCSNAIFLAVGTGIGAGILVDGNILRGSNDIAGAIGWLALDKPFYDKYISCGCFEYNASGEGIAKVAKEYIQQDESYTGEFKNIDHDKITTEDVFEAFNNNDALATRVLNNSIEFWGMAVANLVSLFNPEKIIFGGGVFGPGLQFLDQIMNEAKKWAQPISITQVKLEGAKLGSDSGLYGAGYLALRSINNI